MHNQTITAEGLIRKQSSEHKDVIFRLTGLWALSEAFLGGILHALKIPFTGLILGGISVIIITAIASLNPGKGIILKACFTVLLIKLTANPYAPAAAYLAVLAQGLLGEIIFLNRNFGIISPLLLGFITGLLSSFQKVFVLTAVFGLSIWESIDKFTEFIFTEIFGIADHSSDIKLSYILIGAYTIVHLAGGIVAGIYAYRITKKLKIPDGKAQTPEKEMLKEFIADNINSGFAREGKKKRRFYKTSRIAIFLFLIIILALSYVYSESSYFDTQSIITMILRSVIILVLWFKFVSPVLLIFLKKKITNKGKELIGDAERIVRLFPVLRQIVKYSWKKSSGKRGIFRLGYFFDITIFLSLTYDEE